MPTRIVLADDHTVLRLGLKALLDMQADLEVVGEAGDGRALLTVIRDTKPDVAIMDIGMPNLNGIDAARQALALCPTMKIVALSMFSDDQYVSGMFDAGAHGYVLKSCDFEELARAVRTVMEGKYYIIPGIAETVLGGFRENRKQGLPATTPALSDRERQVLQLLSEGLATKAIGIALNLGERTVETHRRQIMEKLNLHSVAELTKYAIRHGLTSLDK